MCSPGEDSYNKTGEDGGKRGIDFQTGVTTLAFFNVIKNYSNWLFSCEHKDAGKFDDFVIKYTKDSTAFLIQMKYRKKPNIIIYDDFISDKSSLYLVTYYFSYQKIKQKFKGQNTLIICTNSDIGKCVSKYVDKKVLSKESPLYLDGRDVFYYTFNQSFVDEFKAKHRNVSDESVKDFFSRLQLVVNYPAENEIHHEFEQVISKIELAEGLAPELCADYIYKKINTWFLSRKEENENDKAHGSANTSFVPKKKRKIECRGDYLTKAHGSAFFCEIRSKKYRDALDSLNMNFKNTEVILKGSTRVLHIISEQDPILNVIKTFQGLQREDKTKILFVDKDEKIEIQMQIIKAFGLKHYTHLVIEGVKARTDDVVQEMYDNLVSTLSQIKNNYKTVILIAEEDDRLAEKFKHSTVSFEPVEKEKLSFSDLSEDSQKRFREMCLIRFQGSEMHLNKLLPTLTSEELSKIVNEEILRKFIRNETITVGKKLYTLKNTVKDYYIPRRFNRNGENIAEEKMWQHIQSSEEKVIVIADSPGMGKSTVLTSLASAIKETNPSLWVLRINIINYRNILWKLTQKNLNSISPWDLLHPVESSSTHFEKEIFFVPKKVVLMIDGVDEVSLKCTDIIVKLIAESKINHNFAKIFITTKPDLRGKMESDLGVTSWTLEPFSEENQITFLKKYLIKKLNVKKDVEKQKCEVYVKTLVAEISPLFMASAEGIPLQTSILAKAVLSRDIDDDVEEWQTCDEFLASNDEKPKLLELNGAQLLDMSISRRCDKFTERYKPRDSQKTLKYCKLYYFALALKITFSIPDNQSLDNYQKNRKNIDEKDPLKLGIVQKVDGQICFTHNAFTNYYLATYTKEQMEREGGYEYFLNLLISILKHRDCEVCIFFDTFLLKEIDYLPANIYKSIGDKVDCNDAYHMLFEVVDVLGWLYMLLLK